MTWIVCQIGAREDYAVARALQGRGVLRQLVTDAWIAPSHPLRGVMGRLGERSHPALAGIVWAPTARAVLRAATDKRMGRTGWAQIMQRNDWFQRVAVRHLSRIDSTDVTVFAYSYAAAGILALAKDRGWHSILGQIDPGPVEARMVDALYAETGDAHTPIPDTYWDTWRQETQLADTILVNSDWARQGLVAEGVANDKIAVLPLASDTTLRPAASTPPAEFNDDRPLRLLFLGQVTLRKGIDIALSAMRHLPDLPLRLDVVGPLQCTIPDGARQDKRIRFHGAVPRSAVAEAYARADVFLFPTRSDGFGLTQLEAQAAGVPVIASTRCGTVVADGVNGLILDPLDAATLADLLRGLVENPARVARLRQGTGVDPRFGLDRLGASLLALDRDRRAAVL